ncbi:outer membrane beta-barrel family protein [Prevotella sp. OH937_COT-195]|uniref:outer membrane beta-barrel family protein n=1 Tax=Prevotella sp. OH937_COT-195 TaxID=2491051 RepID=UPI000F64B3EF|nr:outer membrane beta-barrel family protein [Prevotella sp. OH937_COT-195]RRD02093.1 TonB-dependent receptor [Prevotella sp. OH937_COT-195]
MKKFAVILFLIVVVVHAWAQRINRTFNNVSLSEALKSISETSGHYDISFIYNELEDFRVTANINRRSVPDAVRDAVGHYPVRIVVSDSLIVVECTHKSARHLTGTITDENGIPMEYANVALLNPKDSTLLCGGVSNASGIFVIPYDLPAVIARMSYVGYKTMYRLYTKENAGTIRMEPETHMLDGVVIKRGRLLMYKSTDKGIMVSIKGTPLEKFGSAAEMMKHLPLMMSDGTIAGHGTPEVYVNSKKVRNPEELYRLSAEDILSAEIITLPGTEYDANVKSVVRLKTARRAGEGWSGRFSLSCRKGKGHYVNTGAELNYRTRNGMDFFSHNYYTDNEARIWGSSDDRLEASSTWDFQRSTKRKSRMKYYFANFGWNWEINECRSVGITYTAFNYIGNREDKIESEEQTWRDGILADEGKSIAATVSKPRMSHSINAYYVGKAGNWDVDFSADYYHDNSLAYMSGSTAGNTHVGSSTSTRNLLLAEKLVVTAPVASGSLTFGEETSHVRRTSDFVQSGFSADKHIRQQTTTWSLFANYSLKCGRFSLTAGLRWQNEHNRYYVNGLHDSDMSPDYSVLVPRASVGYAGVIWTHTLSFHTTRSNPPYGLLSSAVNYRSKYEYDTGNPSLKPSTEYTVSWISSWKWLHVETYYQYVRNGIRSFQYGYDDVKHPGVMMFDYRNMPRCRNYGIILNMSPKIDIWQMNYSVTLGFSDQDNAPLGITHKWNGLISSFSLDNTLTLPHDLMVNIQGNLNPYNESGCAQIKASGSVDMHIGRQFLKDKSLYVAIVAKDIFHTSKIGMTAYGGIKTRTRFNEYRDIRRLGIDISWNFNATHSRYKGSHAGQSERDRL